MQIAVSAPRSLRDLTMIADKLIKQKLENAKGVGQVRIVGGAKREIHVLVDPDKLRSYNLTITDVFNALKSQNLELPGGSLKQGARDFTIRTTGRVTDAAQFNQIAIANRNGYVVKVSDIGYSEDSYEEPVTAARLDGVPAVTLVVSKQSGENTVTTANDVKDRLKVVRAGLPKDIQTQIIGDQSTFIEARHQFHSAPSHRRQHSRIDHHLHLPRQLAHHADRGDRDSDFDHFDLRADGGDGLHAQPDHHAGADADGRHRDRRRHHRAREHLPLHGRKGHAAVPGRHRRHAGKSAWR